MRTKLALGLALAVVALGAASQAEAVPAATPKTSICGQIKHGPHATYTMLLNNKKISGDTWTVFATGVPCAKATQAAPTILKWWRNAKIEGHFQTGGFACNKEVDRHGSSGSAGCSYKGLTNIELMMTGSYTVADLKRLFFIR